ncbi:MAG: transposase [Anaerolineaceae bacterium]|nr:transposase [Anaerolineaceae bacterium]
MPLPNYTLSSVCPRCNAPVTRRACKVLCPACGFMWDCSEL